MVIPTDSSPVTAVGAAPAQKEEKEEEDEKEDAQKLLQTIDGNTEMGYLMLSDCTIYLKSLIAKNRNLRKNNKWINVDLRVLTTRLEEDNNNNNNKNSSNNHDDDDDDEQQEDHQSQRDEEEGNNNNNKIPCPKCNLVIRHEYYCKSTQGKKETMTNGEREEGREEKPEKQDFGLPRFMLDTKPIPRSDGTIITTDQVLHSNNSNSNSNKNNSHNIINSSSTSSSKNHHQQQQQQHSTYSNCSCNNNNNNNNNKRSDAVLLLGTILEAQDHGYVSIQKLQILLLQEEQKIPQEEHAQNSSTSNQEEDYYHKNDDHNNDNDHFYFFRKFKASLVVTLSFPSLNSSSSSSSNNQPITTAAIATSQHHHSSSRRQSYRNNNSNNNNNNNNIKNKQQKKLHHHHHLRCIVPNNTASTTTSNNNLNKKPLPSSVQLILSLIQCDWTKLDWKMKQQQQQVALVVVVEGENNNKKEEEYNHTHGTTTTTWTTRREKEEEEGEEEEAYRRRRSSFFPSKLSLEELYIRILGSRGSDNDEEETVLAAPDEAMPEKQPQQQSASKTATTTTTNRLCLMTIPLEILKTQIAPYLKAKSLDSLRCTCKPLHTNLNSIVPGLKLRLFRHQIRSLRWIRHREIQPISESKGRRDVMMIKDNRHNSSNSKSNNTGSTTTAAAAAKLGLPDNEDSDPIRAMTGGQSTWLCPRWKTTTTSEAEEDNNNNIDRCLQLGIRVDQMTGLEIPMDAAGGEQQGGGESLLDRKGARGGLLCDDPGLGKTITILALILQTAGLSTITTTNTEYHSDGQNSSGSSKVESSSTSNSGRQQTPSNEEEQMFQAYWKEGITVEFRRQEFCRIMKRLKRLDASAGLFIHPVIPELDGCEDYFDVIKRPMCFNDISKKIEAAEYGRENSNFDAFVDDVELCFVNAMDYNPIGHDIHDAARNLLDRFRKEVLVQFKKEQLGGLRSTHTNGNLRPNSSVAALMKKKSEQEFQKSLLQSSSTLIVIPHVLMDHWLEQIKTHVDFRYITNLVPLIYEYTPNRKSALGLEEAVRLCRVDKSHFPLLFVDKAGTHKLPSPDFLAMFMIVITTTRRFSNEWKNGSFQEEIKRKEDPSTGSDNRFLNYRVMEYGSSDEEACPLLKVHWLRMIIDEGHAMGRGKSNLAVMFATWIHAQRRWAMTGTPTQQTASQNGLNNMHGLLQFLQHDFFSGRKEGDKVWKRGVSRGWKDGNLASFFRLKSLLSLLMIRHTKLDIEELEPPIYNTTVVPMSTLEITTYNTLVSAVQGNLKLTSMEGRTSGQQDSLLNRSQAKHAQLALTNIRRVCCGGTRIIPVVTHSNWVEFIQLCMIHHKMPQQTVRDMELYLQQTTSEQLSRCHCCGMLLSMLLVFPCGHLVCTECMDNQTNVCIMCDKAFDVDDFQRLQPGLDYKWVLTEEHVDGPSNNGGSNMVANAAAPPERQHAETNNETAENGAVQIAGAQDQVFLRPPQERRPTRKKGDGHVCEFSGSFPGKCTLCFQEHDHCKLANQNSCCQVCFKKAQDCPESESKACFLVNKLLKLYEEQQKRERDFTPTPGFGHATSSRRRLKVIVFSQFRETLNCVGNRLLRRFGAACVAEYWGKYRTTELHKFVHDPDCFAMLLGKDGSEGLDLSFVTHLFFLEAIWDKSLQQQAVARAWRMGATGPVLVETLLAKNSVEEQVNKLDEIMAGQSNIAGQDMSSSVSKGQDYHRGKIHFLLKSLKLMPDIELAPLPAPEQVQKRFGFDEKALNPIAHPEEEEEEEAEEPIAKKRKVVKRRVGFNC